MAPRHFAILVALVWLIAAQVLLGATDDWLELFLRRLNAEGVLRWSHPHASAHLSVLVDIALTLRAALQLFLGQVVLKLVGLVDVECQVLLQLRNFTLQLLALLVVILSLRLVDRI